MRHDPRWDGLEVVPHQEKQIHIIEDGKEAVYTPPGMPAIEAGQNTKQSRICGLRRVVFWSALALLAVVIIGAAVGGGVGGALAKGGSSSPSALDDTISPGLESTSPGETTTTSASATATTTTTTTTTSSAPATSGTSGVAENPCPGSNSTLVIASSGSSFIIQCNRDWPRGIEAADGSGKVFDLDVLTEYTLHDCIDRCVEYNDGLEDSTDRQCKGVTYEANLTSSFGGGQGGNCFLKNKAGKAFDGSNTTMTAGIVAV
ncbi:hypothetical protein BJY04DRAFT_121273 [Aspergillus karnatakaensis]|uniref:uncharacterized protein n=1 Tax=Aspergillus karnatakaensis TaxID=1810916 RepID=UPI003CCDDAD2